MSTNRDTLRREWGMTKKELILLARLLILYSCFVEMVPNEQKNELELAIQVLLDAQRLEEINEPVINLSDIPF